MISLVYNIAFRTIVTVSNSKICQPGSRTLDSDSAADDNDGEDVAEDEEEVKEGYIPDQVESAIPLYIGEKQILFGVLIEVLTTINIEEIPLEWS